MLQSDDTSYVAERAQFEFWSRMDEAAKAQATRSLIRRIALLQERGLRLAFPNADDREIELRAAALRIGADRVRRLTGFDAEKC